MCSISYEISLLTLPPRFYGDPELSKQAVHIYSSRLTILQLCCVAMGSLLSGWGSEGRDIIKASRNLVTLYQYALGDLNQDTETSVADLHWVQVLFRAASAIIESKHADRELLLKLVHLGRSKKAQSFLGDIRNHPPPYLGIVDYSALVPMLKYPEDRVRVLQHAAQRYFSSAPSAHVIIRYFRNTDEDGQSRGSNFDSKSLAYATGLPHAAGFVSTEPCNRSKLKNDLLRHYQWLNDPKEGLAFSGQSKLLGATKLDESLALISDDMMSIPARGDWKFIGANPFAKALDGHQKLSVPARTNVVIPDLFVGAPSGDTATALQTEAATNKATEVYKLFLGDVNTAALFVRQDLLAPYTSTEYVGRLVPRFAPVAQVEKALQLGLLGARELRRSITEKKRMRVYETFMLSLTALGVAATAYNDLGDALVTPTIVTKPLSSAKWISQSPGKAHKALTGKAWGELLTREQLFSCIAYFGCGLDIEPSMFKKALAISSGDSIFVAGRLLADPLENTSARTIRHIVGNVGRPGLALLVPPANLRCLKPNAENWKLVGCEPYGGIPADNFKGATLSLSFTNWRIPIDLGDDKRGHQDVEACIYEAVVSIYDRSKWIADIDILESLSKGCFDRANDFYYKVGCTHDQDTFTPESADEILTINNWEEFLDHPTGPVIFMAHKNWPARLAAAALAVGRHDRVFVLERFCWRCMVELKQTMSEKFMETTIFIC